MTLGRRYETPIAFEIERDPILGSTNVGLFLSCRFFHAHWSFHFYWRD